MSQFRDAAKQMLLDEVRCPECHEGNVHGASLTIEVDLESQRACCTNCGKDGPLVIFLPKEKE